MARTIEEIQNEILNSVGNSSELNTLEILTQNEVSLSTITSNSKASIWRLFIFIISFSIQLLEKLFDAHKTEVDNLIKNQKSGTLPWYRTMALRFQFGFSLMPDSDNFENGSASDAEITASKVVKYAAVSEGNERGLIILKIAGENGNNLQPVTSEQVSAFQEYMMRIKYAGTKIQTRNYLPDLLSLNIDIYRDPLILTVTGVNIITGESSVELAILNFLKQLPFDGELIIAHLVDALQQVDGVIIPHVNGVWSASVNPTTGAYESMQPVHVRKIPESGYFLLENLENINYVV